MGLVIELIKKQIRVIAIKQNLDIKQHDMTSKVTITLFSLFSAQISLRTKEALAGKSTRYSIRPQKSKFDNDAPKIKELLELGLSVRKIAIFLGYSNHIGLNTYVKKTPII